MALNTIELAYLFVTLPDVAYETTCNHVVDTFFSTSESIKKGSGHVKETRRELAKVRQDFTSNNSVDFNTFL